MKKLEDTLIGIVFKKRKGFLIIRKMMDFKSNDSYEL